MLGHAMRSLFALAILAALSVSQAGWADTIIDTFDDFDPGLWPLVVDSGTPLAGNSQSGVGGVVGGVRNASVEWMSGPLSVSGSIVSPPGLFSLSSDVLTDGVATLTYPGQGGLNLDLLDPHGSDRGGPQEGGTPFRFENSYRHGLSTTFKTPGGKSSGGGLQDAALIIEVVSSDLGGVPINVTLTDGGANSASASRTASGAQTVSIPLTDFAGLDFSDIDQIEVEFDPAAEFDITVDFIGFDWPEVEPEPEPASILVWSLVALIGIVVSRRFRGRSR
jgi:hypothetical protein